MGWKADKLVRQVETLVDAPYNARVIENRTGHPDPRNPEAGGEGGGKGT